MSRSTNTRVWTKMPTYFCLNIFIRIYFWLFHSNEGNKLSLINSSIIPTTHTSNKREISQREISRKKTEMGGLERPKFVLFGSSIVQLSYINEGWGAVLAHIYARKVFFFLFSFLFFYSWSFKPNFIIENSNDSVCFCNTVYICLNHEFKNIWLINNSTVYTAVLWKIIKFIIFLNHNSKNYNNISKCRLNHGSLRGYLPSSVA